MIQVYTGNGKGKTTAAFGLALRASGAGLNVHICQFVKAGLYSEVKALKKIKNIKIEQFGRRRFIRDRPDRLDFALARKGLKRAGRLIAQKKYQMVILDEVNVALKLGLVDLEGLIRMIKKAPRELELILTGRFAHPEIIKLADLVSEIKEVKHYFKQGQKARPGMEF